MRAILFVVLFLPLISFADATGKSDCVWREPVKKGAGVVEQFEITCPVYEDAVGGMKLDRVSCRVSVTREGKDEKVELSVREFIVDDKNRKNDFSSTYKVFFYPPDEILLFYGYQSFGRVNVELSRETVENTLFDFQVINHCIRFAKSSPFVRVTASMQAIMSAWSKE